MNLVSDSVSVPYLGNELDLFENATTWKAYFRSHLAGFIGGRVLEVGAGFGGTTKVLCTGKEDSWLCLEQDADLVAQAAQRGLPDDCRLLQGNLGSLAPNDVYDTVLYVDVLEHIEADRGELELAAGHLRAGGHLIVLAPAHQWLFSPFDEAIGHFRRYTRKSLRRLAPPGLDLVRLRYLDSVGLLASLGNALLLKSSMPRPAQLRFWDRCLVPISRWLDPLCGWRVGKSVYAVWRSR